MAYGAHTESAESKRGEQNESKWRLYENLISFENTTTTKILLGEYIRAGHEKKYIYILFFFLRCLWKIKANN